MRFKMLLEHISGDMEIPFNYNYLLSAAIYGILSRADGEYATFLHDSGYQIANKTFKLFCFSDLIVSFKPQGDRMRLISKQASFVVSFHLPVAAENFIKGLFMDQELPIFDRSSRALFRISQVESLASPFLGKDPKRIAEHTFSLLSPIVVSKKDENGGHHYLSPLDAEFIPILIGNWKSKFAAIYKDRVEDAFTDSMVSVVLDSGPPKSRLIKIRANSKAETSLKGWYGFKLKVKGSYEAVEVLFNAGAGSYNSSGGMGCLGEPN